MKKLFKAIFISLLFLGSVTGIARAVENFTDVQSFYKSTLTSSISSSATTINVSSAPYVNTGFFVIEPRTPNQEIVLMTSRSGTALTVTRGLSATSSSAVDAGYKRAHAAGSAVEMVDVHYYIKQLQIAKSFQFRGATTTSANLAGITGTSTNDLAYVTDEERFYRLTGGVWVKQGDNSETIGGTKTFSSQPQVPTPTASTSAANAGYVIPISYLDTDASLTADSDVKVATQKATKAYADGIAIAGGVTATNGVTGIQRVASSTQIATGYSSTTAYAIPSSLASSTASSTTIVVATKSSTGKIDPSFLNGSTENYTFNGTTTLAGTVYDSLGGNFLKFGGTGADGALTLTSGTTTINLGNANYFEKNYTSISITGTGTLAFSNPSALGTIIKLRSQSECTLTSSTTPNIDVSGIGGSGGSSQTGSNGLLRSGQGNGYNNTGGLAWSSYNSGNVAGQNGNNISDISQSLSYAVSSTAVLSVAVKGGVNPPISQTSQIFPGGGGGGATSQLSTASDGGRGGGALDIECAGTLVFSGSIWAKGATSTTATALGGYGAGGTVRILSNSITTNTGSISVASGGNAGQSLVATSTRN